jgi:hypothetical protein
MVGELAVTNSLIKVAWVRLKLMSFIFFDWHRRCKGESGQLVVGVSTLCLLDQVVIHRKNSCIRHPV